MKTVILQQNPTVSWEPYRVLAPVGTLRTAEIYRGDLAACRLLVAAFVQLGYDYEQQHLRET